MHGSYIRYNLTESDVTTIMFQKSNLFLLLVVILIINDVHGKIEWTQISGGLILQQVSSSINYIYGVDSKYNIYRCDKPCTGSWKKIDGLLKQLDVSDMEVWGVTVRGEVFKLPADASSSWVSIPQLKLKQVSASGNGYVWGTTAKDDVYYCKKPCNGDWKNANGKLKQVDGGEKYMFGVNSDNNVFNRLVDGSGGWMHIDAKKMTYITVGAGEVFGIEAGTNKAYRCVIPCTKGEWKEIEFCVPILSQIEAAVGEIVGIAKGFAFARKV